MALKKQLELDCGIIAEYLKIENVFFSSSEKGYIFDLFFYKNEEIRRSNKDYIKSKNYTINYNFTSKNILDLSNKNILDILKTYCYEYLKTLEEFKNSEDC